MSKSLADRLQETQDALHDCETSLATSGDRIPKGAQDGLAALLAFQSEVPDLLESLGARAAALSLLGGLEDHVDAATGAVDLLGRPVKFQHVRLIAVQSYLAIQWSIADRVTEFVGRVFLPKPAAAKERPPPIQLLSHFVGSNAEGKSTAGLVPLIRETFGRPLAVSYEMRNLFCHFGGQVGELDLFEGSHPSAGFRVSKEGWARFLSRLARHQVEPTMHRRGQRWPVPPLDDLRPLLRDCESDVDDALGMLLRAASHAIVGNVLCLLGTD